MKIICIDLCRPLCRKYYMTLDMYDTAGRPGWKGRLQRKKSVPIEHIGYRCKCKTLKVLNNVGD